MSGPHYYSYGSLQSSETRALEVRTGRAEKPLKCELVARGRVDDTPRCEAAPYVWDVRCVGQSFSRRIRWTGASYYALPPSLNVSWLATVLLWNTVIYLRLGVMALPAAVTNSPGLLSTIDTTSPTGASSRLYFDAPTKTSLNFERSRIATTTPAPILHIRDSPLIGYVCASPTISNCSPISCHGTKNVWLGSTSQWGCSGPGDRADFSPATGCVGLTALAMPDRSPIACGDDLFCYTASLYPSPLAFSYRVGFACSTLGLGDVTAYQATTPALPTYSNPFSVPGTGTTYPSSPASASQNDLSHSDKILLETLIPIGMFVIIAIATICIWRTRKYHCQNKRGFQRSTSGMARLQGPASYMYTMGWICALPIELEAAQEMLDEEYEGNKAGKVYTYGRIGKHYVVLVCLPAGQTGTNQAATAATEMKSSFPSMRFGLMVGIGGGVPSADADIRLGDVVVSQPGNRYGGVVQYDYGKTTPDKIEHQGFLSAPPSELLSVVSKLRANHSRDRSNFSRHMSKLSQQAKFAKHHAGVDVLFEAGHDHLKGHSTCKFCDPTKRVRRKDRDDDELFVVHYGTIASGNQVMRDGKKRDAISSEFGGVLCFEMEAAGFMNSFPCLVIRGICDYADSHKNKTWQPYAAATAAAYAKELLLVMPAVEVTRTRTARKAIMRSSVSEGFA